MSDMDERLRVGNSRYGLTPHERDARNGYANSEKVVMKKGVTCPSCGGIETFSFKGAHGDNMACSICDRTWKAKNANSVNNTEMKAPWKCDECGKKLPTDDSVKKHKNDTGHSSYAPIAENSMSNLVRICSMCKKTMGEKEPFEDKSETHGYCDECLKKLGVK